MVLATDIPAPQHHPRPGLGGECHCGGWVGAEWGFQDSGLRDGAIQGTFWLSAVCPVSWFGGPLGCYLVLDPEAEHSLDIILVGSSELSSPPSPGPRRGEGFI